MNVAQELPTTPGAQLCFYRVMQKAFGPVPCPVNCSALMQQRYLKQAFTSIN